MKRAPRTIFTIATLAAGITGSIFGLYLSPREAAAAVCPQFLTAYCVVNSAGVRMTVMTNPCFARQRHWRILYRGHCRHH
jgi:hypothetical protein